MRIAQVILPKLDNDGQDLQAVHYGLRRSLAKAFGGYTALDSHGGWIDDSGKLYDEPGVTYQIACEPSDANRETLRQIAVSHGRAAAQLAVFVSYACGTAEIIDLAPFLGAAGGAHANAYA